MVLGGRLGNFGTDIEDISLDCDGFKLGIVVLNQPVESNIVAVVLLHHIISHLFYLEQI